MVGVKKKEKWNRIGTDADGPSDNREPDGAAAKVWLRGKTRMAFLMVLFFSMMALYFLLLLRETKSVSQLRAHFKFEVPGFNMLRSAMGRQVGEGWVQYPVVQDETRVYLRRLRRNLTSSNPCVRVRTHKAYVLGFPNIGSGNTVRLTTGTIHELTIVSFGADGARRCAGGDYFETDLSGPYWKSRPPVVDLGNGSYELKLQVDSRFAGHYQFKVILLFANFHGLHLVPPGTPSTWVRDELVANFEIQFVEPDSPQDVVVAKPQADLKTCRARDFKLKQWSGRWTREKYNKSCNVEPDGRYLCLNLNTPCERPWCDGPLGRLESNGWVYSAHCSFKIFTQEEAWQCLDNKWILWWGDSSHMDTARNMLNFVLGFELSNMGYNFDRTFFREMSSRKKQQQPSEGIQLVNRFDESESKRTWSQKVRMSNAYYGFDRVRQKVSGLSSISDPKFQNLMDIYFNNTTRNPDFVVLNSGFDDAFVWADDLSKYVYLGAETAAQYWKRAIKTSARVIYRHSVASAGLARSHSINPQKLELYSKLLAEAFLNVKISNLHIVDNFDLTFPWHYDNECSDGPHYGRPPSKSVWVNRQIGHQYFVDLMLVHILLNAMCSE